MKKYNQNTVDEIRAVINYRITLLGPIKSQEIVDITTKACVSLSTTTVRNIFRNIMDEMVEKGFAIHTGFGKWDIIGKDRKYKSPGGDKYLFLNKEKTYIEIAYQEVKDNMKEIAKMSSNKYVTYITELCERNKVTIPTLLTYINENKRSSKVQQPLSEVAV